MFNQMFYSFEAVDRIRSVPIELFDEGYRYFSFDVTSLFTNIPLSKLLILFYTEYIKKI